MECGALCTKHRSAMKFTFWQLKPLWKDPLVKVSEPRTIMSMMRQRKFTQELNFGHPTHSQSLHWLELYDVMSTRKSKQKHLSYLPLITNVLTISFCIQFCGHPNTKFSFLNIHFGNRKEKINFKEKRLRFELNSCYYTLLVAGSSTALTLYCTLKAPLQKQATQSL